MRLEGKTAIVTGGASGFGAGIARKFAAEGARVLVADINGEGAAEVAGEIGNGAFGLAVDVSNDGSVSSMAAEAIMNFGKLDILVNNAGGDTSAQCDGFGFRRKISTGSCRSMSNPST